MSSFKSVESAIQPPQVLDNMKKKRNISSVFYLKNSFLLGRVNGLENTFIGQSMSLSSSCCKPPVMIKS